MPGLVKPLLALLCMLLLSGCNTVMPLPDKKLSEIDGAQWEYMRAVSGSRAHADAARANLKIIQTVK